MIKKLKLFLLVSGLLMFFSVSSYSQVGEVTQIGDSVVSKTSNGVSTVYNDLKSAAPSINKAVNSLAKELKVGVNAVWDVLVRQQLVWSYCYLTCLILGLFSWIHFYYRVSEGRKNSWGPSGDSPTSYHLVAVLTLIMASVFSVVSMTHFSDMLTGFVNPEFGAMKTIADIAEQVNIPKVQ